MSNVTRAATVGVILLSALLPMAPSAVAANGDGWVSQVGTYDYLVKPDYDGLAPVGPATAGMTLGLGTFDHLNGELVMIGGVVYRVGTDGVPAVASPAATTPFLQTVRFDPDRSAPVPPGTLCSGLPALVDGVCPPRRSRTPPLRPLWQPRPCSTSAQGAPCSWDSERAQISQEPALPDCTCMGSRLTEPPAAT